MASDGCGAVIAKGCFIYWVHLVRDGSRTCPEIVRSWQLCLTDQDVCKAADLILFSEYFTKYIDIAIEMRCGSED